MKHLKLLNIEDSESDSALLKMELERSGFLIESERVETAEGLREMLREREWDVIISDYSLPGFSGLDAFEILKQSGLDIPFVMISGTIGEETAVAAMKAGISDYLMKDNLGKIGPTIEREMADAAVRKARHEAERALAESEEDFRGLVEATTQYVWELDARGNLAQFPQWWLDLTGQDFEVSRNYGWAEFIHPDDREDVTSAYTNALEKQTQVFVTLRIRDKEGIYRYYAARGVPLRRPDGTFRKWICTLADISERMLALEAVKKSEAEFRELFENANDLIYTHDLEGNFTSLNRAGETITGYPREEALKLNVMDVVAPEFRELAKEKTQTKLGGERSTSYETVIIRKDGGRVTLDLSTRLIHKDGAAVGVQGIARDISQRKMAEEALRRSEQQLRVVTDTVPAVIAYVDNEQICRFANRTYCEWLGKPIEDVIDRHLSEIQTEESYKLILPEIEAALSGERFTLERTSNIRDAREDSDEPRHLRLDYVPDINADGTVLGYFAFAIDLSETKQAQEALRNSEEQLMQAQKLESIGRLAGGIAHDFNNMLTAITGYSDLALRRMKADDPLRHHVEEILKAGKRSAELTNQLLAFSRRQMLQPRIIDVNHVITDTMVMLRRLIGEDIDLTVQLGEEMASVNVDPGQLSQILVNLVINSRDAMPEGGSIVIETGNRKLDQTYSSEHHNTPPGDYVMIAVSDNGVGMDEETRSQIFEPFFTTKEVGKGTGLGLSTVYGVVKQSNGNVWVYTEPGQGTTIKIYLPSAEAIAPAEGLKAPSGQIRFGTETILLVEDEDVVRNLSREVLQSCGYTVIEASNGVEALEIFERMPRRIDLLMTDVVMPQMGGRDLAKKILELQPDIKILFTSGYTDSAAVRHGVLEKGSNFIAKPFTFGQLAGKLKEVFTGE